MPRARRTRGQGGWWFLAAVLAVYALLAVWDPLGAGEALAVFGSVMGSLLPVLGLVFVLLFLADLLLDEQRIRHHLGQDSGLRGWLAALLGGIVAVGPVYAWYAMAAQLREKGMRSALIVAFLYSRALKIALLPMMIHYFGVAFTVVFSVYLLLFAVISGYAFERIATLPRR